MQIVGTAILAVFADILSPAGWKKYITIVTGMILLVVIVSPVSKWHSPDIIPDYQLEEEEVVAKGNEIYKDLIKYEFSKNVAKDIKERIRQEFSKDVLVEVMVEVSEEGGIDKISKIIIKGKDLGKEIGERISHIYNVSEVILDVA